MFAGRHWRPTDWVSGQDPTLSYPTLPNRGLFRWESLTSVLKLSLSPSPRPPTSRESLTRAVLCLAVRTALSTVTGIRLAGVTRVPNPRVYIHVTRWSSDSSMGSTPRASHSVTLLRLYRGSNFSRVLTALNGALLD